jgi:hypothetical protein
MLGAGDLLVLLLIVLVVSWVVFTPIRRARQRGWRRR